MVTNLKDDEIRWQIRNKYGGDALRLENVILIRKITNSRSKHEAALIIIAEMLGMSSNQLHDSNADIEGRSGYTMYYFVRHNSMGKILMRRRRFVRPNNSKFVATMISRIFLNYLNTHGTHACYACPGIFTMKHYHNINCYQPRIMYEKGGKKAQVNVASTNLCDLNGCYLPQDNEQKRMEVFLEKGFHSSSILEASLKLDDFVDNCHSQTKHFNCNVSTWSPIAYNFEDLNNGRSTVMKWNGKNIFFNLQSFTKYFSGTILKDPSDKKKLICGCVQNLCLPADRNSANISKHVYKHVTSCLFTKDIVNLPDYFEIMQE